MYQRSASSAIKSMHAAIKEVRVRTAVDAGNAALLLTNLECKRFCWMKQKAWGGESALTPHEKEEYDITYTDLVPSNFTFNFTHNANYWQIRVQRTGVGCALQNVKFPKEPKFGSYFGTCTCGADKVDAIPCDHMAAIALSSRLRPHITPMSIMPYWWLREHWQRQFPEQRCMQNAQ